MQRILNLVDDPRPGGIQTLLGALGDSQALAGHDWRVRHVNPSLPIALRGRWDSVVVHYPASWRTLPALALLRARHPRLRIILQEHHYTPSFERRQVSNLRRFHSLLRTTYRLVDTVVCVSRAQADWLIRSGVVDPGRVRVIPPSRDLTQLLDLARRPLVDGRVAIGALGRLDKVKGLDTLVSAMHLLAPSRFELKIAGTGPEAPRLKQLATGRANIEFVGHVADPAVFLGGCHMLAMPSRQEAYGMACAEARAAALPVVVADTDGLPEQVGEGGVIVPVDNAAALAAAIERIADVQTLERMGSLARQGVRHAWPGHLASWRRLLRLDRRHSPTSLQMSNDRQASGQ